MQSSGNKIPVKKTIAIPTSLSAVKKSIKDRPVEVKTTKTQTAVQETANLRNPFDKPTLQGVINDIIEEFKQSGKSMEVAVLRQPIELVDEEVTFLLSGDLQNDIFQKVKPELTGLLRKRLENYKVDVFSVIKEDAVSSGSKLYTSTDKLNYLREKSPALKELQKRFGLETDF
ncbi:DNA polymerase III subunit gamma/tau [Litoribacter alkaliphilus]|uniref:DNA polymerase III subunit gamma/tau n=1 Tax=Litoribacter ruber TaxID=702568 RepID=A0AAP2CHW3_9BACT|nr:DNA polymerase III subunit gamma/tau [Litoribacter alkaliphilus]